MNCESTDSCAEDIEFYVIWIDLDCLTLAKDDLKTSRNVDRFGECVNNVKYITD